MSSEIPELPKAKTRKTSKGLITLKESLTLVHSISSKQSRILNVSTDIQERSAKEAKSLVFMAKPFVQLTLPHRDPGEINEWVRHNGRITMAIRPSWENDAIKGGRRFVGIPYGTIPRLLLIWMSTEVLHHQSRYLELGKSLYSFMKELGLDPISRGKNSPSSRLKEHLYRLLMCVISIEETIDKGDRIVKSFSNMTLASEGVIEWYSNNAHVRRPYSPDREGSWFCLSETFYECLTSSSVPLDKRIINEIKQSPLALDLYAWMVHRTYGLALGDSKKQKASFVSWQQLHDQFGANYGTAKNFKQKVKPILKQIKALSLNLHLEEIDGGLSIGKKDSRIRLTK